MADKKSNPADAWREMLGEWEKNVNSLANKAMEREDFSRLMGTVTGATTSVQGAFGGIMERYLSTLNLPSRADINSVGERLATIEAQLNRLEQIMRTVPGVTLPADAEPEAPKPARTRKPASAE